MCTFKLRRSVFWGLVVSFLLAGMVGCQAEMFEMNTKTKTEPTPQHVAPKSKPQAKPTTRTRKPVEASEDSKMRRPSHFRRKLRAKYA